MPEPIPGRAPAELAVALVHKSHPPGNRRQDSFARLGTRGRHPGDVHRVPSGFARLDARGGQMGSGSRFDQGATPRGFRTLGRAAEPNSSGFSALSQPDLVSPVAPNPPPAEQPKQRLPEPQAQPRQPGAGEKEHAPVAIRNAPSEPAATRTLVSFQAENSAEVVATTSNRGRGDRDDTAAHTSDLRDRAPDLTPAGPPRYPPDGGLPADTAGDGEGETPEQAFERFRPAVAELLALDNPTAHEDYVGRTSHGALIFEIGDPADAPGEKNHLIRIVPHDNEKARVAEQQRAQALLRARGIPNRYVRRHLEEITAYDPDSGLGITRKVEGTPLGNLSPDNKRAVRLDTLADSLAVTETMINHGIVPSTRFDTDILVDTTSGDLTFTNVVPIEQTTVDSNHSILATAEIFDGLADQLQHYEPDDAPMRSASEHFRELSQMALREYFMYDKSGVAFETENLSQETIRAIYARTLPRRRRLAYDAHVASEMLDLALSSPLTVAEKLEQLEEAHRAYSEVVYQRMIDGEGNIYPALKTDHRGNNLLVINDHFLQARLALAFWPVYMARVQGTELSARDRASINRDLATVLDEMADLETTHVTGDLEDALYAHFGEVSAMTLLSRQGKNVDTPLALPTSEVRRQHGGPDATIPFSNGGGYELDIDWKLRDTHSGEVAVANIFLREISRMADPPVIHRDGGREAREAVMYTTQLLRDEGLSLRELTDDESAYLDRAQEAIWERIRTTALESFGIVNLGQRTRF